eukprot:GEMP01053423.1.p1 GENE.GEMP01053423.1~~GEMP01053423.1.p1  ORF type:complete len:400 (+),score=45.09 GEMP01053423.1:129-1328(+)
MSRQAESTSRAASSPAIGHSGMATTVLKSKKFIVLTCTSMTGSIPKRNQRKSKYDIGANSTQFFDSFTTSQFMAIRGIFNRCDRVKKTGVVAMPSFIETAQKGASIDPFLKKVGRFLRFVAPKHLTGYKTFLEVCCILLPTRNEKQVTAIVAAGEKLVKSTSVGDLKKSAPRFQEISQKAKLWKRATAGFTQVHEPLETYQQEICLERYLELRKLYDSILSMPIPEEERADRCIPQSVRESWPDDKVQVLTLKRLALYFGEDPTTRELYHLFYQVAAKCGTTPAVTKSEQVSADRLGYLDFNGFCTFLLPAEFKACPYPEPGMESVTDAQILSWLYRDAPCRKTSVSSQAEKEIRRAPTRAASGKSADKRYPSIPPLPTPRSPGMKFRKLILDQRGLKE